MGSPGFYRHHVWGKVRSDKLLTCPESNHTFTQTQLGCVPPPCDWRNGMDGWSRHVCTLKPSVKSFIVVLLRRLLKDVHVLPWSSALMMSSQFGARCCILFHYGLFCCLFVFSHNHTVCWTSQWGFQMSTCCPDFTKTAQNPFWAVNQSINLIWVTIYFCFLFFDHVFGLLHLHLLMSAHTS